MALFRFAMLLALVVWIGGIIFFAFILAPTVFSVLPTRHLAGQVVNRSLHLLHWTGIVSGIVFLAASMSYSATTLGSAHPAALKHALVYLMIALTVISLFVVSAKMDALRTSMGIIDDVPPSDARRIEFNRLHHWSTRLEGAVLLLGLATLYLTARQLQ
ncbi:MAG TPA: DUF4149 domain-containing protein [Terriglobales bacterium]|nr:DUF4149 domain-containing protein [Terriglobales bacterium]